MRRRCPAGAGPERDAPWPVRRCSTGPSRPCTRRRRSRPV